MIILDLIRSIKRVPDWLYSYFILGCVHTDLSSLPQRQPSGEYTLTCMNCGKGLPTMFGIDVATYPNRQAKRMGKRLDRKRVDAKPKKVSPIRKRVGHGS